MSDLSLVWLDQYFHQGAYEEGLIDLDGLPETADFAQQTERRRARAWLVLALGRTEQAYQLFWSCAHHPGGRAGLLILTILAGQVEAGIGRWQRYCDSLREPPLSLPDGSWHAKPVILATVGLLERYPFPAGSRAGAAASIYRALLYRAANQPSDAFMALASAAEVSPLAALLRDRWLDEIACLPAPSSASTADEFPRSNPSSPSSLGRKEDAVGVAARLLLYPELGKLQAQAQQALDLGDWPRAMEMLRRCLVLEPEDTITLERRWRLFLKLREPEAALGDLYALVDIYERRGDIGSCQRAALEMVEVFPSSERALLKMCFLQARLGAPLALAHHGRKLLELCRREKWLDRLTSYRLWLLRQRLTPDDREEFKSRS